MPLNFLSQLEVIIIAKNNQKRLSFFIRQLDRILSENNINHRLIVVDETQNSAVTRQLIHHLSQFHPVEYLKKTGPSGHPFSILQASNFSAAPHVAVIDSSTIYPLQTIIEMYKLTDKYDLVLTSRSKNAVKSTPPKSFQLEDEAGPLIVKNEIIKQLTYSSVSSYNLKTPLINTTRDMAYSVGYYNQNQVKLPPTKNNIGLIGKIREYFTQLVKYKLKSKKPLKIFPANSNSMIGSGVVYRNKRFVTHTTLDFKDSAVRTLVFWQKIFLVLALLLVTVGLLFWTINTLKLLVAALSIVYFIDLIFNLFLILRSLHLPPEIDISQESLESMDESKLPIYSILCPMYKEADVLPQFIESIKKINWPKDKLDCILLLEEDDDSTIEAASSINLPTYIRVLVVPKSQPKTKPKACNYGLAHAKGEYLVIYDAEDSPDPLQLKKVYLAFHKVQPNVKCIQAKLNYYNSNQNILTRLFTAEYSLWFDVILTGLQTINTIIPLGGTSNHFKTSDLKQFEGWDPFNVTEDADLGVRLFKRGAKTAIVNSVTYEEANSKPKNWLRQRSRWVKGYIQTYLVHIRNPLSFIRNHGWHALYFHLSIGGKIAFMLINPIMWVITIAYFSAYNIVGPTIESLYPPVIFYIAAASFAFGNFLFLFYYMIGLAKRQYWWLMKYVFLVPFYWLMASVAAVIALYQLAIKPYYWEKTIHGLHLGKAAKDKDKLRILILNWRDIRHAWSGGAEVYVHEIAKRLASSGNEVTLFCSNDRHSPSNEYIDGVKIVRKGGFYTVYLWALLYYIFKFRRQTDVVVDSINGIPFFSPLYTRKPVVGILYHVHQQVFKDNLPRVLSSLACFIEAKIMPPLYRRSKMVTISPSSKLDMYKLGFSGDQEIETINPGIEVSKFRPQEKTINPSILYLGRLKAYKSIDTLLKAMVHVIRTNPKVTLNIAGFGESREYLEKLVRELGLSKFVNFLGKVSEEVKVKLLSQSWVFVQPSSMEGWGIVAIEANASGTPVIASNVPGLRDSISNPHNGFLVTKGNSAQFAQKINLLINNEKLRHKMEKGSLKWSKNFSWDKSANQFLSVINKAYEERQ